MVGESEMDQDDSGLSRGIRSHPNQQLSAEILQHRFTTVCGPAMVGRDMSLHKPV